MPVQSSLRPARHHPETGLRSAEDAADARTATQVALSLSGNQESVFQACQRWRHLIMSRENSEKRKQEILDKLFCEWFNKLNTICAPIIFGVAASFVDLVEQSKIYSIVLILFSIIFLWHISRFFPNEVRKYREKTNPTNLENKVMEYMGWRYFFSLRNIQRNLSFFFAWCFMVVIAMRVWFCS